MAIIDVIKFDGLANNENWLIYKAKIGNIAYGSQLVVGMGQEAIFVKGGKAQDIFSPNTYTLKSGNLPLLRKIIKFDGQTPFAAEVVFVNTTVNRGLKWGTKTPVIVKDFEYDYPLSLRSFGEFGVKIKDTRNFVNQLVGTVQLATGFNHELILEQFNSLINTKFRTILSNFWNNNRLSFQNIDSYCYEISSQTFKELENPFAEYGLDLTNFFVESISAPKEEYEGLQKEMIDSAIRRQRNRTDNNTMRNCPFCNQSIAVGNRFCSNCGRPIPQQNFCPQCGHALNAGDIFCSNCGRRCN